MLLLLAACDAAPAEPAPAPAPAAVEAPPPPRWPAPGAPLRVLPAPPPLPGRLRVVIDAGHGAPGNPGNTSARCESEADFTLRTQDAVVARLAAAPELEVRAGRPGTALLGYDARIAAFEAWPADAVVSLHSDARAGSGSALDAQSGCWTAPDASGFTVLYSDEGPTARVEGRRRLARALGAALVEAGFPPYGGENYRGLYDPDTAGVFVDRHAPGKRIKMLRGTTVPTVIVETHQALDRQEAERWDEPATLDAFAAAVRVGVHEASAGR